MKIIQRFRKRDSRGFALVFALLLAQPLDVSGAPDGPVPARGGADVPALLRDGKLAGDPGFKYRILVERASIGRPSDFEEDRAADRFGHYAELGFNIISPRRYFRTGPRTDEELGVIERAAKHAGDLGMYYLQWQRGSFNYKRYDADPDTRFVHRDGIVYDAVSPSSERFWELLEQAVLPMVEISVRQPVMGVFFDFEKYAPDGPDGGGRGFTGHWYPPSYDDAAWERFFSNRGEPVPDIGYAERHPYLAERGLAKAFATRSFEYWNERMRALRKKIDAINPRFRFFVYPQGWTDFINRAMTELGTERAPLVRAAHMTYRRGNPIKKWSESWRIPDEQALRLDEAFLSRYKNIFANAGHDYIGGIYTGGLVMIEPQLAARKAALFASFVDGFWVFGSSELDPDTRLGKRYDEWWTLANRAAIQGERDAVVDLREWNPHVGTKILDLGEIQIP